MDYNQSVIESSHITNLRAGWSVRFQNMPETFSDSKTANWNQHEIVGRWTPIRGYSSSSPRTIAIMLTFCSSINQGEWEGTNRRVLDNVNKLRSLQYPNYNGMAYSPDPVLLRIGNMIFMKCICTSFDTNWRAPWDLDEQISMIAEVSLTFEECTLDPLDAMMVIDGHQSRIPH